MKGPKPVCTSARKKMNQSSPRRLCLEGCGFPEGPPAEGGTTLSLPTASLRRSPSLRSRNWNSRAVRPPPPLVFFERRQAAGRAKHHDRRILLVFGGGGDLGLGQFQRDAVALVVDATEMQRVPVDDDLAAADAEEAAEIDHGGAHRAGAIDNDVDDASHVLIGRAANLAAKYAVSVARRDDRDGGRWHRLLRRSWWRGLLCRRGRRGGLLLVFRARGHRSENDEQRYENEPAACAHAPSSLSLLPREDDRYLDLPAPAQHFHRHAVAMTPDLQVDAGVAQLQFTQHHLVEEGGQPRI